MTRKEPHPTIRRDGKIVNVQTAPVWRLGSITCADCGARLIYGRDGEYRHSAKDADRG